MKDVTPTGIRRALMDFLARREQSETELLRKLSRKYPDHVELIAHELSRLKDEGLQSDLRMAENFARSRTGRGQGPVKIRSELRSLGVSDDIIEQVLLDAGIDWAVLAGEVAQKKFGDTPASNQKERARRARFLQQRGFSFDHMKRIL